MKMIDFCKNPSCPTSQDIFAYQAENIAVNERADIQIHISNCDFCGAEAEIYSRYPVNKNEPKQNADIPIALRELAESLLNNSQGNKLLNSLLIESEGLKLKEA